MAGPASSLFLKEDTILDSSYSPKGEQAEMDPMRVAANDPYAHIFGNIKRREANTVKEHIKLLWFSLFL